MSAPQPQDELQLRARVAELERKLAEHKHEVDTLLGVLPVGVAVANDPDCRDIRANPAFAAMLGLDDDANVSKTSPEAERLPFRVFQAGQEVPGEALPMQVAARENREVRDVQLDIARADGQVMTELAFACPLHDEAGRVRGSVGVFLDITERQRAGQALRESEARFRTAFEWAVVGMSVASPDGRFLQVNAAFCAITGRSEADLLAGGYHEITHPDDRADNSRHLKRMLSGEADSAVHEKRYLRPDGSVVWVRNSVSVVRDAAGQATHTIALTEDITLQRQAEAERERLLTLEREARETAELLNRVGPVLVEELNQDSLVQKVTDLGTQLAGARFGAFFCNVRDEQGESARLDALSGASREDFAHWPRLRHTTLLGPTLAGDAVVRVDDITTDPRYGQNPPHGGLPESHLPIRSYLAAPVRARRGKVIGALLFGHPEAGRFTGQHERLVVGLAAQAAIALDNARLFAAERHAREELHASNEALRQANAGLEEFAYVASHDLQEPLRTISGFVQLLTRRFVTAEDAEAREFAMYVQDGVARMEQLIRDLLAYSRTIRAEPRTGSPAADLNRSLSRALSLLEGRIRETGAEITGETLPEVAADEGQLTHVFQNLLSNALKYRRQDVPCRIRVSAARQDAEWIIVVQDNGVGFDPRQAERIFGLFKRLHRDAYPGTGLGLAICRRIVERQGGRVWAESAGEDRGATFRVALPAVAGPEQRR